MSVCVCVCVYMYVCVSAYMCMCLITDLPVGAVATAAHGPGDEGARDPRLEANGGECCAVFECTVTNFRQIFRESEGSDPTTSLETLWVNCNQRFR